MIPADLDINVKLNEMAGMNAVLAIGLKDHSDTQLQCRILTFADDAATSREKLYLSHVLAAVSIGLATFGPHDLLPKARELHSIALSLFEQATHEKAGA